MDLLFYRNYNDDISDLNDIELTNHYNTYGINENRVYDAMSCSIKYFNNSIDYNDSNFKNIFCNSPIITRLVKTKCHSDKINILIYSNCQGNHISLLNKLNIFSKYFKFTYIANYVPFTNDIIEELNSLIPKLDILIYQPIRYSGIGSQQKYILNKINKTHVMTITLTYLYCDWYWIFGTSWKHTISFMDSYKNKTILKEEIGNIIHDIDFKLEERMEKSFEIFKEKEQHLDIKLLDFIKKNYKYKRLFFTKNHVTKPVIIFILNEFLKLTNINIQISDDFDIGVYNSYIFQPISKYVKEILNLEFQEDPEGDQFYIDFFYDVINDKDNEYLNKKYECNENKNIYKL